MANGTHKYMKFMKYMKSIIDRQLVTNYIWKDKKLMYSTLSGSGLLQKNIKKV